MRDFAQVKYDGVITGQVAKDSLDILEVDKNGLDLTDKTLLMCMIDKFGGGPVGLDTLSVSIGEEAETIEDVVEPYLIQQGFIKRTPRGRVVTNKTYEYKINNKINLTISSFTCNLNKNKQKRFRFSEWH